MSTFQEGVKAWRRGGKTDGHQARPVQPPSATNRKNQEYTALDASIAESGLVLLLIVNLQDNCLIGGHQRLSVLLVAGETETNAVVDLDEAKTLYIAEGTRPCDFITRAEVAVMDVRSMN